MQDLNEAIILGREALNLLSQGQPYRSGSLSTLANRLATRYKQVDAMQDLDEAIVLHRAALALRPRGHPDRSASLANIARNLRSQFARSRQLQDQEELFSLFAELMHIPPSVSSRDLSAARA